MNSLQSILKSLFDLDWMFAYLVVKPMKPGTPNAHADLSLRMASSEELLRSAKDQPRHFDEQFVRQALAKNDVCAAAFKDEEIVGFVWGALQIAPHDKYLNVQVEHPYLYAYKSFVKKEYRGSSLSVDLINTRDLHLQNRGLQHTVMFIETKNKASLNIMHKVGGRPQGYVGFFRWRSFVVTFHSPKARTHKFKFVQRKASDSALSNPN
ncbi:MAG: GNAT family N-acetyltransferase [Pseudomonadota bacterium]